MGSPIIDVPPYRPPSEASSLLLRLVRGCPWNQCTFCPMYRHIKFERRKASTVMTEIDTLKDLSLVKTVFLGDSDPLLLKGGEILAILEHLYGIFPTIQRVTAYARIDTILKTPFSHLKALVEAGLHRLHVGLETGSSQLLKAIKKGPTPQEMIDGIKRAKAAGFQISCYVLIGIGGVHLSLEHAMETFYLINQTEPPFIRLRTLFPISNTPIYQEIALGSFQDLSPLQRLQETRSLVEGITIKTELFSDHVSNYLKTPQGLIYQGVAGRLPEEKDKMLQILDETIYLIRKNRLEKEILPPLTL